MLIEFKDIEKNYGNTQVLNIEHIAIDRGECVGLVGNNGAGKTTSFSLLLDLIRASKGQVFSKGSDVANTEDWKQYTSAFIDDSFLIDFLTPDEYFEFVGKLHDWNKATIDDFLSQFEEFFNGEIIGAKKYIRDLSKGNKKKVGIIAALIGDPEIVILDEPFSSLDPTSQNRLKNLIKNRLDKHTFLISSHDLLQVVDVCNRYIILEKGRIVMDKPKSEESVNWMTNYFDA